MEYVAILRARRVLYWYGGAVLLFAVLAAYSIMFHHGRVRVDHAPAHGIPLDGIIAVAAAGAVIVASFLAGGLAQEYRSAAIALTRPIARLRISQGYVAVAALAMLTAFLITLVAGVLLLALAGVLRYVSPYGFDVSLIALVFGCAAMWYALVLLVSLLLPGRTGAIVGLSWAYALIIPGLVQAPFPGAVHGLFYALQYLSPMSYIGSFNSYSGSTSSIGVASVGVRAALEWGIAIAALVAGMQIWAKREVPAS